MTSLPADVLAMPLDDDGRWRATLARDRRFDGAFVFGVRTTGIYCRPSCPARRPRREGVAFFSVPDAAEEAGFRSCRRCRPREAGRDDPRQALVRAVCRTIEERRGERVSLAELAAAAKMSPHHLQRTFTRLMGLSPRQYAEAVRLGTFKQQVKKGDAVTDALYEAGYGSSSRLYEQAPARLGMTPATYKRGGRGARIAYTIVASPLGRLLVAATERGVAGVRFGERDGDLERGLRAEFPAADLRRDAAALRAWASALVAHLSGDRPALDLPLDIQATAFQARVWAALRAIPYGETRSYADVARAIGRPAAVRAVARACATNPVAVAIPCHRVVPRSGGPGGYRWGTRRKEAMLARERAHALRRA